jgi:hypothetical protein
MTWIGKPRGRRWPWPWPRMEMEARPSPSPWREKDHHNTGDETPLHQFDLLKTMLTCSNQMMVNDDESHTPTHCRESPEQASEGPNLGTEMQRRSCYGWCWTLRRPSRQGWPAKMATISHQIQFIQGYKRENEVAPYHRHSLSDGLLQWWWQKGGLAACGGKGSPCRLRKRDGGMWYVSNVSIIFEAPCLFIHHLLYVLFTLRGVFMHFLELTY